MVNTLDAQELLGYEPRVISSTDPLMEVSECNGVDVEAWPAGRQSPEDGRAAGVRESYLGAVVRPGLFAPLYTPLTPGVLPGALRPPTDGDPGGSGGLDIFPADGSLPRSNLSQWCGGGNELCCPAAKREALGWSESTCVEGRW